MSTERELLEAAARAAGQGRSAAGDLWSSARGRLWVPHEDDGDALRLAAALRIDVEHNDPHDRHPWVCASVWTDGDSSEQQYLEDVPDESQRAARMRLAILKCAAAQAPKEVGAAGGGNGRKTAGNGLNAGFHRGCGVTGEESA